MKIQFWPRKLNLALSVYTMDSLPTEVLSKIYNQLELIYKITFSRAYARISRTYEPNTRDLCGEIRRRSGGIADLLQKYDAAITGGFILDCMFGTYYSSDIDILFDVGIDNARFWGRGDIIAEPKLRLFSQFRDNFYNLGARTIRENVHASIMTDDKEVFCVVRKYIYNGAKIDIIICEPGKLTFVSQYDFDFCKVLFTGLHLIVFHPISIIKKYSREHRTKHCGTLIQYTGMENITTMNREHARCEKYRARGFTIDCSDQLV
jgi:hypothetical protein